MLYNDVCTLVENVQQELCNDVITMYNVSEQCLTMLHDIVKMCTCPELYFLTLPLPCNVREQYATIRNISFDVDIVLQQCGCHYNHVHSCYNV